MEKKEGRENSEQIPNGHSVKCAKDQNKTKLKFLGPLLPPQVRGMLNQLLLALPRGKSISKRGRVQRLGARSTRSRYGWDIWTRKVRGVI